MSGLFEDTNNRSVVSPNGFFSRLVTRSPNRKSLESGIDIDVQKSEYNSFSSASAIESYLHIPFESKNGNTSNSVETDSCWSSSDVDEDITLIDYKKFHGNFSKKYSIVKESPPRWQMPFLGNESTSHRKSFENCENSAFFNQKCRYVRSQRISLRRLSGLKSKTSFQHGPQDCNDIIDIHENKEKNIGELLEDWPP